MRSSMLAPTVLIALAASGSVLADQPAVTVYNQSFGVVREHLVLDLQPGLNEMTFTDTTAHLEPDSVILRDPAGGFRLQIVEQNYRNDPVSQELLLSLYQGKTIDFVVAGKDEPVSGRIVRSGYVPHRQAWQQYGYGYYQSQMRMVGGGSGQPIIEIDGQLRFGLPGTPVFPSLADDTILKPTLHWLLETDAAGKLEAEISYVTGGMSWKADYNVVAPEEGETLDLVGWVTIDNQSGRDFHDARIKLMAGDVSKIRDVSEGLYAYDSHRGLSSLGYAGQPPVTEKAFDEYHLYTLQRPTTLLDRQTKQVEFQRAGGISSKRLFIYDGAQIDYRRYQGWDPTSLRNDRNFGAGSNPKIWVMREFENCADNGLGMPLPAGRVRFYRRDADGQLEFTGENVIDHTPKDETVRVYTGNAFDLVGERIRTHFAIDHNACWLDEAFELRVRNHKDQPVEVRIVEHLYRWRGWKIVEQSDDFIKSESQTIEYRIEVPANGEKIVTYKVHYTW